jgi:hypothetical protein
MMNPSGKSFLRSLLVFGSSIVVAVLFNLPFGWASVLEFVTQIAIFTVITMAAGDLWYKLIDDRDKIIWQYWAGVVATLGADFCFLYASRTTTFPDMWLWLSITATVSLFAGLWWGFVYAKAINIDEQDKLLDEETAPKPEVGVV